jgi:hypothetical protein
MEIDGEVRSESGDRLSGSAIATFAAELASVVEQLGAECSRGQLNRETVARVHDLRERAEEIFGNCPA